MNPKIAQTYVQHEGQWFFVSTINRESSAMEAPIEFAETIVWELNADGTKGAQMAQSEDCKDCIGTHLNLVDLFHTRGNLAQTIIDDE